MRRHDSLRALFSSLFVLFLLTAVLPASSLNSYRSGRSSKITKRAVHFNSNSPAEIKLHRNDAEGCHALPWFGGFLAIGLDSGFSAYAYSQHQEPLSLWNPDAGRGRSPPSHFRTSQL